MANIINYKGIEISTFITNEKNKKLKKRIEDLIQNSKELKFLVGFFYFSGIRELYESLKDNPTIQIGVLVGLNVDKTVHGLIEYAEDVEGLTDKNKFENFLKSVSISINSDDFDNQEFYEQIKYFLDLIKNDRLRIRKTYNPNHAKIYIFKIKDELQSLKKSVFITGSSNLTKAGLTSQEEFNVEISDYGVDDAEDYFNNLWKEAAKITEVADFKKKLIELIEQKTLIADVTPFEAFALVLKNYIETQEQKKLKPSLIELLIKRGYRQYKYQIDAVSQALTIIDNYGGVIISDVVGLGKSVIASMVAKSLGKRGIIICPPGIIGDDNKKSGWKKYKEDFELYDWEIRSLGFENLKKTLDLVRENDEYEVIIVDEVHRFRNQDTEAYEVLSNICKDKIVMLLTATPFNNTPADIFALLKLFIIPGKSKITLENNLEHKFKVYNKIFRQLSNIKKNYNSTNKQKRDRAISDYETLFGSSSVDLANVKQRAKYLSNNIRQVIEPVLIRRNRIDLKKDPEYSKEVYELSEIKDPKEAFFKLTEEQSDFYDQIIEYYFGEEGLFKGAIYRPFTYEVELKEEEKVEGTEKNFEYQSQTNLYDFMRRLLVKRFESSFGAFRQSIENFRKITDKVQQFIINSDYKFILDRKLIEKIYEDDIDEIEQDLKKFEEKLGEGNYPKSYKIYKVNEFKYKDKFLADIESDRQLFEEVLLKLDSLKLVDDDPKLNELVQVVDFELNHNHLLSEPQRKVIIFTEYIDTVKYLEDKLEARFPDKLITVKGDLTTKKAETILENFDAAYSDQENEFQILLTTDKLSEGVNLNRAGSIINYDIPWNPTRVIQRVGRINRISKKVFENLYIYNFFPTIKGSQYVKSREIAENKMFLIHNTLGEDSKIFEVDEEPTAAGLFKKIMINPEALEEESFYTRIRSRYFEIAENFPETIHRIKTLPPRIKVAKNYSMDSLLVFIKKGLGFFIRGIQNNTKDIEGFDFENIIDFIECSYDEKAIPLSINFWENYLNIKDFKERYAIPSSEISNERRALNNLKTLFNNSYPELEHHRIFIRNLIEDILEYKTLSDFTLRKIANLKTLSKETKEIKKIDSALKQTQKDLGKDYLDKIKIKIGKLHNEIIIAIENIKA